MEGHLQISGVLLKAINVFIRDRSDKEISFGDRSGFPNVNSDGRRFPSQPGIE